MSTDPLSSPGLRPLMPRPFTNNGSTFSAISTHFCSLHNPKLTSWTQSLCDYGGKREMNRGATVVSSRWNPTAEQVQALEEMYRRGTRNPSAEQIQQITAKLRRFGKIEGKNVFYWFQNHKARDRQKKRRQLDLLSAAKNEIPLRKHSGLSRKYMEVEDPKKLPTMSKCSSVPKYDGGYDQMEELKRDRLQQQRVTANSISSSCRNLGLSSCDFAMHRIGTYQESNLAQEINAYNSLVKINLCKLSTTKNDEMEENTTLELFPVRGINDLGTTLRSSKEEEIDNEDGDDDVLSAGNKLVPNQFFEFLPTKK